MIATFSFLGVPFQSAPIHCGISKLRPQAKRNSLDQQPQRLQQLSFGDQLALATQHTKKAATQCAQTWAGRVLSNGTRQHSWDTPPGSKFLEVLKSNETWNPMAFFFWEPLAPQNLNNMMSPTGGTVCHTVSLILVVRHRAKTTPLQQLLLQKTTIPGTRIPPQRTWSFPRFYHQQGSQSHVL